MSEDPKGHAAALGIIADELREELIEEASRGREINDEEEFRQWNREYKELRRDYAAFTIAWALVRMAMK